MSSMSIGDSFSFCFIFVLGQVLTDSCAKYLTWEKGADVLLSVTFVSLLMLLCFYTTRPQTEYHVKKANICTSIKINGIILIFIVTTLNIASTTMIFILLNSILNLY